MNINNQPFIQVFVLLSGRNIWYINTNWYANEYELFIQTNNSIIFSFLKILFVTFSRKTLYDKRTKLTKLMFNFFEICKQNSFDCSSTDYHKIKKYSNGHHYLIWILWWSKKNWFEQTVCLITELEMYIDENIIQQLFEFSIKYQY